jgi:hypothetical protein
VVWSLQLLGSRLQHRTSSDAASGIGVPAHELQACSTSDGSHSLKDSSNSRRQCYFLLCQLSVLFYRRSAPLGSLHLDLLKRTPQSIPSIFKTNTVVSDLINGHFRREKHLHKEDGNCHGVIVC